ncbi:MAG: tRNA (adenosine(37)-N6)-threonylcarbamoyltransferase complex ATPase subunit type 1 TsaE [Candidatus Omnitrophota bacterium]
MTTFRRLTHSYEETLALGEAFAGALRGGDAVCLFGDLGAGKTVFVKGMVRAFGISSKQVHSPTFTLMNIYEGRVPLYHFDLYRICAEDLHGLGYEEFFYGKGIAVVEWSERLEALLPRDHWHVLLEHAGDDTRAVTIGIRGDSLKERWQAWVKNL